MVLNGFETWNLVDSYYLITFWKKQIIRTFKELKKQILPFFRMMITKLERQSSKYLAWDHNRTSTNLVRKELDVTLPIIPMFINFLPNILLQGCLESPFKSIPFLAADHPEVGLCTFTGDHSLRRMVEPTLLWSVKPWSQTNPSNIEAKQLRANISKKHQNKLAE